MEGTTGSLENLCEDHHALAEAVHDLRGRVGLLEARVDYLEHGQTDACKLMERTGYKQLPSAIETGLSYCGHAMWMVTGKTGIWCGKRNMDDYKPRSIRVRTRDCHGRWRSKILYLLSEHIVDKVLEKYVASTNTNTKGNSDGG